MSREEDRKPGRSFDDPSKSMGTGVVKRGATDDDVANRAKAVSVLRKAEEFIAHSDPADPRRALELAAGRIGIKWHEYRKIVDADPELLELERKFQTVH
jgi:hypothetical protein